MPKKFFQQLFIIAIILIATLTFNREKSFAQTITDSNVANLHTVFTTTADGATHYLSHCSTSNCISEVIAPQNGTITDVYFRNVYGGTPTAETATTSIVVNGVTTDLWNYSLTGNNIELSTTTLNIAVNKGEKYYLKTVYPTFVTNPTSSTYSGYIVQSTSTEITASGGTGTTTEIIVRSAIQNLFYGIAIWCLIFGFVIYLTKKFI